MLLLIGITYDAGCAYRSWHPGTFFWLVAGLNIFPTPHVLFHFAFLLDLDFWCLLGSSRRLLLVCCARR
jgi:hypothetical protein